MKTAIKIFILFVSLILAFFSGIFLAFLNEKAEIPMFNYALWQEIQKNRYQHIDFENFGNGDWNRVCFFGPYNEFSSETLGFDWKIANYTNVLSSDAHNVLVFTTETEVIDFVVHSRSKGDFWELSGKCLNRNDSELIKNENSSSFNKP